MADNQTDPEINGARWQALTNGHYHSQRESFLGFLDRLVTFIVLLAGAGVVLSAISELARRTSAVAVTVFATFQLVFAIGPTARRHATLCEKYFTIAADLELGRVTASEANAAMLKLAGEEGPVYAAAHALSENWAKGVVFGDQAKDLCKVGYWKRLTRHICRHSSHDFHC